MAPIYTKTLVIGATSGIGQALAAKLLANGTSVIITGRRQDRLDAFISAQHSSSSSSSSPNGSAAQVSSVALDITQLDALPAFAASIVAQHPDLDSIVLNAGIQRAFDFARPDNTSAVDLATFDAELTTNYTSIVHLVTAFLPHLQKVSRAGDGDAGRRDTHLIFVSASLGLLPTLVRTPGYNATKAALHAWITAVRQQLRDAGHERVRLVEVFPPAVQTELHDEKHQPDMRNGGEIGMPLEMFVDRMYAGLGRGEEDQFAVGPAEEWLGEGGFEAERTRLFAEQQLVVKKALAKYIK